MLPDNGQVTTKPGRSPGNKSASVDNAVTSPAPGIKASAVSTSGGGAYGAGRSYGSHAGVDISMSTGTPLVALCDGVIAAIDHHWYQSHNGQGMGLVSIRSKYRVGDFPAGTIFGYGHVDAYFVGVGESVSAGRKIALSGNPDGGPHLHFYVSTDGVADGNGNVDPTSLAQQLLDGQSVPTTGGNGSPSDDSAAASVGTDETSATAAAFATFLDLPGILDTAESMTLKGQKSLMNDKPLFPFIEQLAGACLRNFQSMPNGNFFAFFPDYFGSFGHRTPYWEIQDIEIIDGNIELSDDALATHVFVVGDIVNLDGINLADKLQSGGVVNVFNAFMADFLNGLPDDSKKKKNDPKDDPNFPALNSKDKAIRFLQKYGARPYYEEAPMVRSPYYEAFLAYQRFCLLWSRQFLTTFQLTFMPELFPGGIVAFPDHGLQCYIDEVQHSCSYETGFTTQVNLSAPAALRGHDGSAVFPEREWVHAGMIRAGALRSPGPVDETAVGVIPIQDHNRG